MILETIASWVIHMPWDVSPHSYAEVEGALDGEPLAGAAGFPRSQPSRAAVGRREPRTRKRSGTDVAVEDAHSLSW
jgi:hypothetical protein